MQYDKNRHIIVKTKEDDSIILDNDTDIVHYTIEDSYKNLKTANIRNCHNLKSIEIIGNCFSSAGDIYIEDDLDSLEMCCFTRINSVSFTDRIYPNVYYLKFYQIQSVTFNIDNFPNLRKLIIISCRIIDGLTPTIDFNMLEKFYMVKCNLSSIETNSKFPALTKLKFISNDLKILNMTRCLDSIKYLYLYNNKFDKVNLVLPEVNSTFSLFTDRNLQYPVKFKKTLDKYQVKIIFDENRDILSTNDLNTFSTMTKSARNC